MRGLEPYLRPMPVGGDVLRFDLSAFRSRITREMLQVRLRLTARVFGTGSELIPASITADGSAVMVDAEALMAANDAVRARLGAGPHGAVPYIRRLSRTPRSGVLPVARYQALGALKFCMPESVRPTLLALLGEPALVEALMVPEEPSLWTVVRRRELALARLRRRGPEAEYRRRLAAFQRAYGYLGSEDVDFRASESVEAIDARIAALGAEPVREDHGLERWARHRFAERLAAGEGDATLVSHVLLARALAVHEDRNRRAKMRLLRDLRDAADRAGLDLETASLADFAVLRSA